MEQLEGTRRYTLGVHLQAGASFCGTDTTLQQFPNSPRGPKICRVIFLAARNCCLGSGPSRFSVASLPLWSTGEAISGFSSGGFRACETFLLATVGSAAGGPLCYPVCLTLLAGSSLRDAAARPLDFSTRLCHRCQMGNVEQLQPQFKFRAF